MREKPPTSGSQPVTIVVPEVAPVLAVSALPGVGGPTQDLVPDPETEISPAGGLS